MCHILLHILRHRRANRGTGLSRKREKNNSDRFLQQRAGNYYYKRRVPAEVADADDRAPHVRISLKTDDLAVARAKRDALEAADNEFWASMLSGTETEVAQRHYTAAVKRAQALGFSYRPVADIARDEALADLKKRFDVLNFERTSPAVESAVLGEVSRPNIKVSEAFDVYVDEIVPDEHMGKSAFQKYQWKKVKKRALNNFIELVEDKPIADITRDDAIKLYNHWMARIAPKSGRASHSASSGNRDIGNMRVLYQAYFEHMGDRERKNPFEGLSFSERRKKSRPPFPVSWIKERILKVGALATMNSEGRGVVLALIETGARPSEICNLTPEAICLDDPIPHLKIMPRDDPDDPREIKTVSSIREVPLIGVALEVFKKHPNGFPRYKNKENHMSQALNKYFNAHKLFPSADHKIYSLRHSFEDRMKDANLHDDLRRILMGHAIDRPKYGSGGSLEWKRDELLKIALPFDASIV